jgi:hypothetical protein
LRGKGQGLRVRGQHRRPLRKVLSGRHRVHRVDLEKCTDALGAPRCHPCITRARSTRGFSHSTSRRGVGGGAVAEPMSQFSGRTKTPTTDSTRIGKPLNVFLVNQDRPATVPLDALVAPEEALEVPPASIPPRDTDRGYGNNRLRHAGPRASNRTKSSPPVTDESSKPRSHSS